MRKALILLLCVACCGIAYPQIKMNANPKPDVISSGWGGFNNLNRYYANGQAYYFLSLTSDNRFDRLYTINLGDKENALATLNLLLNNFSTDASFACEDMSGEAFWIFGENPMEKRYMIKKDSHAGYGYLRLVEIKKFIKALSYE